MSDATSMTPTVPVTIPPGGVLPVNDKDIDGADAIWVLLTAYFVFTMQSGGLLIYQSIANNQSINYNQSIN